MNELYRIIDANANRAREGLRVMEDVARFALDDSTLTEIIKDLRHSLKKALDQPAIDRGLMLTSRESIHDEGRGIKTEAELKRQGVRDIAGAAGSRVGEALRSLEECVKAVGGDSRPIEDVRYRSYDADKQLMLALPTGKARQWKLCVLVTEALCKRPWLEVVQGAIEGGADCIQLREKELESRELLERARELVSVVGDRASVIVNDRPDVAMLAGADGVHLGQTDMSVEDVRGLVGFGLVVGVSTSNVEEAREAVAAGADYCGVGPMFATATKHKPEISGPGYLKEYLADPILAQRPHLAIGGITPENIGELRAVGCRGVAVSSVVCGAGGAGDVAAVCRKLIAGLAQGG